MTTIDCPICSTTGRAKRIGQLAVRDCPSCGHGWLENLAADNEHSESETYSEWRSANEERMRQRAIRYVDGLVALTGRLPRSAAEIGCSTGETVGLLAERGGECWGVDMAAPAIAQAQASFPKVHFAVDAMPAPDRPVEAVLMMHVIEHIPDTVGVLTQARKLVTDDGVLYLRLPNYKGLAARVLRGAWPDYMADHVHYFTSDSLGRALAQAGWTVAEVRTSGQAWAWLGGIKRLVKRQRPITSSVAGPPPGQGGMSLLDRADRWGRPLFSLEARLGVGNEMIVLARAA